MTTAETPIEPLRRNRQFQLLWVGSTASALGSHVSALAYPLLVLALTGSPGQAGVVGGVGFATALLFSLPGGVWVDRWGRRGVLLWCEGIRAVSVGTIALATYGDWLTFAHIVVVAGINGAVGALFTPAREVAIRSVVRPEHLAAAYSQEHARIYGATLVGPPAGGLLFSLGRAVPFIADAVSYLVSLICVWLAKVPRRPADYVPSTGPRSMRADIAGAAHWLWGQRLLRAITLFVLAVNLGGSMLSLPTIILVQERGGSPTVVGIVMAATGVGGLVGAVLAPRISALLPINHLLLAVCAVDALLLLAMVAPFGPYWPGVPLLLIAVLGPALAIPLQVQLAKRTPESMMARVQSLLGVSMSAVMPVGPIVGGLLTEAVGVTSTIVVAAGMFALCVLGGLFSPTLRRRPDQN
jgi:MFS family permease